MKSYYLTEEWKRCVEDSVGMNDMAVKLISRFVHDIYAICEEEYQKEKDVNAFSPVSNIQDILFDTVRKGLAKFHRDRILGLNGWEDAA